MNYSVDLQAIAYDKAWWYLLLLVLLGVIVILAFVFIKLSKKLKTMDKEEPVTKQEQVPMRPILNPVMIKNNTLQEIAQIEYEYGQKLIDSREACLKLSIAVRLFIKNMTGREADCETYAELRLWGFDALTMLMENLYGLEFAGNVELDASACINDAKGLVARWN